MRHKQHQSTTTRKGTTSSKSLSSVAWTAQIRQCSDTVKAAHVAKQRKTTQVPGTWMIQKTAEAPHTEHRESPIT